MLVCKSIRVSDKGDTTFGQSNWQPEPQAGRPQPPPLAGEASGESQIESWLFEADGAAGTLHCFSSVALPHLGQLIFSSPRNSSSNWDEHPLHSYS